MTRARITAAIWVAAAIIFTVWSVSAAAQQLFAPGKVDNLHSKTINKCSACHDALKGAPDSKCLKCHKRIVAERKISLNIHAKTGAPCAACHRIHGATLTANLISATADIHPQGGFFVGKHARAACRQCHRGRKIGNVSKVCETCHKRQQQHVHQQAVSGPCSKCHTLESWRRLRVNHAAGADCSACHQGPANHANGRGNQGQCSTCHTTSGWTPSTIHSDGSSCTRCHQAPANHSNGRGNQGQCSTCHTTANWTSSTVHDGGRACSECHQAPANHLGPACGTCHTVDTWQGATFNHPPIRRHSPDQFPCASCHPSGYTSSSCTCHGGGGQGQGDQGGQGYGRGYRY